jgi:hypothetical protein
MTTRVRQALACALLVCLPHAAAQTAILQLQVIEGEGAVQRAGGKSARPLAVQVTDETGRPLEGVAVSFRLPDDLVTGVFSTGLRSEIAVTGPDGRASVWNIQWGAAPGPVRIRVTAAKDQARAGIVVNQYVSESVAVTETAAIGGAESRPPSSGGKWKWMLLAAGAVGGGLAAGMMRSKQASAQAGNAGAVTAPPVQIGPPTVSVGKP